MGMPFLSSQLQRRLKLEDQPFMVTKAAYVQRLEKQAVQTAERAERIKNGGWR